MGFVKNKSLVIPVILFGLTFLIILSGIFQLPSPDADSGYYMDMFFYYSVYIIFFFTGAFLINKFVKYLLWRKVFKITAGSKTIGLFENFIAALIYILSTGIILTTLFEQPLTGSLILILLILILLITALYPKFNKIFNPAFLNSVHPFKIGDWIKLIHNGEGGYFSGEVVTFDRSAIQLKTEDDTLIIFPNVLLDDFIIENYRGIQEETKFILTIKLDSNLQVERAKRILLAASKQALSGLKYHSANKPQVIIHDISKETIEYKVNFWIIPWKEVSPEKVKDLILANIIKYLKIAGVGFNVEGDSRYFLKNVMLFKTLNDDDIEKIYNNSKENYFEEGAAIIKQYEEGSSMYILIEGLLNVFISSESDEKQNIKVGEITPGEFFGEMSLLTGECRSATINAETDSIVFEITKDVFKSILKDKPDLINEIGKIIVERQNINILKLEEYKNKKDSIIEKIIFKIKSYFDL